MTVHTDDSQIPAPAHNRHARQPWEDPAPVRAHLRHIRDQGGTYRAMAAGVPEKAVQTAINSQERIDPAAAALLTITPEDLHQPRLPAGGTRLRLRSLMAMGHGYTRLARAAGTSTADIRRIIHGQAAEVTPQLHDRVRRVWEAWWDKTPPVRTAAEAAAATKARVRARRGGWCTPLGLDEDLIDRVGYQPGHGWLPAVGTATAPDQEPSGPGENRLAAKDQTSHTEEGNTMPFDPVPRQASEYQKGAAFGHATVIRQIDGGVPADRIQETQDAARQTLLAAARTDGEWEFCDGYTAAVDGRLATLRAAQRAERDAERWERAAEPGPGLEAG
jgi:hypothetical protein